MIHGQTAWTVLFATRMSLVRYSRFICYGPLAFCRASRHRPFAPTIASPHSPPNAILNVLHPPTTFSYSRSIAVRALIKFSSALSGNPYTRDSQCQKAPNGAQPNGAEPNAAEPHAFERWNATAPDIAMSCWTPSNWQLLIF